MQKNLVTIYLAFGVLAVAFAAICLGLFLFGESPSLLRHKFKIGSMLILFTGYLGACDHAEKNDDNAMCYGADGDADGDTDGDSDGDSDTESESDDISCYDVAENQMLVEMPGMEGSVIELDLQESNIISGKIYYSVGADFSFRILDGSDVEIQAGAIAAMDGEYDDYTDEDFEITVDTGIPSDDYTLNLYATTLENVEASDTWPMVSYTLILTNEP